MAFLTRKNDIELYSDCILTRSGLNALLFERTQERNVDNDPFIPVFFALFDDQINYNLYNPQQVNAGFDNIVATANDVYSDISNLVLLEPIENDAHVIPQRLFGNKDNIPNIILASSLLSQTSNSATGIPVATDTNSSPATKTANQLQIISQNADVIDVTYAQTTNVSIDNVDIHTDWITPVTGTTSIIQSIYDYNTIPITLRYNYSFIDKSTTGSNLDVTVNNVLLHVYFDGTKENTTIDITNTRSIQFSIGIFLNMLGTTPDNITKVFANYVGNYTISIEIKTVELGSVYFDKRFIQFIRKEPVDQGLQKTSSATSSTQLTNTQTTFLNTASTKIIQNQIVPALVVNTLTNKTLSFNYAQTIAATSIIPLPNVFRDINLKQYVSATYNNSLALFSNAVRLFFYIPTTNNITLLLKNWVTNEMIPLIRMQSRPSSKLDSGNAYAIPISLSGISLTLFFNPFNGQNQFSYYVDNSITNMLLSNQNFQKTYDSIEQGLTHQVYTSTLSNDYVIDFYYPSYESLKLRTTALMASSNWNSNILDYQVFQIFDPNNNIIISDGQQKLIGLYNPIIALKIF